jgi:hypothetical protein
MVLLTPAPGAKPAVIIPNPMVPLAKGKNNTGLCLDRRDKQRMMLKVTGVFWFSFYG